MDCLSPLAKVRANRYWPFRSTLDARTIAARNAEFAAGLDRPHHSPYPIEVIRRP